MRASQRSSVKGATPILCNLRHGGVNDRYRDSHGRYVRRRRSGCRTDRSAGGYEPPAGESVQKYVPESLEETSFYVEPNV